MLANRLVGLFLAFTGMCWTDNYYGATIWKLWLHQYIISTLNPTTWTWTQSCGGPVLNAPDYLQCSGGFSSGAAYCQQGYCCIGSTTPCVPTINNVKYYAQQALYDLCMYHTTNPDACASILDPCMWTTCSAGTPTYLYDIVLTDIWGTCPWSGG